MSGARPGPAKPLPCAGRVPILRPMLRRLLWILLGLSATAWAGQLTTSQERVLTGIARERFSGRWTDLTTNQLLELRKKAEAYDERLR